MPQTQLPYFYDAQMRRIIIQFMRIFTMFQIRTGRDANGYDQYVPVPVVYGDGSAQAFSIINLNSENTTLSVPRISCRITNLRPAALDPGRGGYNGNSDDLLVTERKFDRESGQYTSESGIRYHIQRLQPNPLDISFEVSILTSNTDHKLQLFEQIYLCFNPSLDIQTTSSPLDWTAIQTVMLDDIVWDDEGAIPVGTNDNALNVTTLNFTVKSYISPPARVDRQVLIHTIIQKLGDEIEECNGGAVFRNGGEPLEIITTPGNHEVLVSGNLVYLLGANGAVEDIDGNVYSWPQLIDEYGELLPGISKIRLRWVTDIEDDSKDIIGYIELDPTIDNVLKFSPISETLPSQTMMPVLRQINPHELSPTDGLPSASIGQRYLLTEEIGNSVNWPGANAKPNDIIEFNGTQWVTSFNADTSTDDEFIRDEYSGNLLRFNNEEWYDIVNGRFSAGYFRLILQ